MMKWRIFLFFFFILINTESVVPATYHAETLTNEETLSEELTVQNKGEEIGSEITDSNPIKNFEGGWVIVTNVSELQNALKDKEAYIKLADSAEVFVIGKASVTITADVTIDGNGRQISYSGSRGFYSTTANLTVTMRNMTFGSPDFSIAASGVYGIFQNKENVQLHIENVQYYSSKDAQPFYLRGVNSKIYFHGTNRFLQQNPDGSSGNGQEFAECNNYEFAVGSHTTIVQNTSSSSGFIWMLDNPSSFTVREDAEVDVTSNHNFIYSSADNNGVILLEKNARLSVKGTNPDKGSFYNFDKPAFLTVAEGAEFSLEYPDSLRLARGSEFKFLPNSVGNFSITQAETVFDRNVGANSVFEIDNAKRLHFQAKTKGSYNPIGFTSDANRFFFQPFSEAANGYEVVTNEASSPVSLTPQRDVGNWTIAADISRTVGPNTPDFTKTEKEKLKNASSITLLQRNFPVNLIDAAKDIQVNEAVFHLKEYQLHGNENVVRHVDYKLYNQKIDHPSVEENGLIQQQNANLTDSVTFANLEEQTNYWLYIQIVCDPDSQSSTWLEVPFETQQELININFPVEMAFHTKKVANQQKVLDSGEYFIANQSSFVVEVQATDLQELSNSSNIQLLPATDESNRQDLLLNLTEAGKTLGALTKTLNESPLVFSDLAGNSSTKIGFSGVYYGSINKIQEVQYRLTLTVARKE